MANLLYARPSDNVASLATITASAADANYPASNLSDLDPARPAKLTTTSGNFVYDFGVAQRVDVVALIHHNLTAGLDVKIQMNATNAWGAPSFSQPIVIPTYQEDGYPVNPFLDLTGLSGYSAGGFRFLRVLINAASGANVAIGEVVIAALKRTLEVNLSWGATDGDTHPTIEHRTAHGVVRAYDLGVKLRKLMGEVDTTDAGLASLLSLTRDARGRVKPFLIVPDPAINDAMLVRFMDTSIERQFVMVGRHVVRIGFEELARGLPL